MSRIQNDFDNYEAHWDWYSKAAGMEFDATWGSLPLFKAEIRHLQFIRVQTLFLEASYHDMMGRRKAVQALASSVLSPTGVPDEELQKWWPFFGTESVSGALADAICTLYNDAPFRTFSKEQGTQDAFAEIYETFEVNHVMKDSYRASLFTNVVAIMPDWDSKKIKVLTPDYFRLVVDDNNTPVELWIAKGYGGFKDAEFEVWSAETLKIVDGQGKMKSQEANPYKRIPAVILKLNRSNDIYGSGISEAAEISVWGNFIRFMSTRVSVFQSYSVGIGVNLDLEKGTRIGPGFFVDRPWKMESTQPPKFEYVSPEGKFKELEEYRFQVISNFERNQGLPGYLVDKTATPPSGVALQVAERQLNEKRKEHTNALIKAEKDLVSLISLLASVDGKREITAEDFGVQYADVETFDSPKDELEADGIKMTQGLTSPSALVLKYFNQRMGDDEAAAFLAKNKSYFPNSVIQQTTVPNNTL